MIQATSECGPESQHNGDADAVDDADAHHGDAEEADDSAHGGGGSGPTVLDCVRHLRCKTQEANHLASFI